MGPDTRGAALARPAPGCCDTRENACPTAVAPLPRVVAACDLPGFALLPRGVNDCVAFLPAHDNAQPIAPELPEPGTGAVAPIEDMAHLASPAPRHLAQQGLLLLPLLPTDPLFPTPPRHGDHLGHAVLAQQQQAFPFKATHTHCYATGAIDDPFAAAPPAP